MGVWADVIAGFKTGAYTVTRPTGVGYDSSGYATAGSSSQFSIDASVQALSGDDLQALPESRHAEDNRKIYTETELRVKDTVVIDGDTFEIYNVALFEANGTHYRAFAAKAVA